MISTKILKQVVTEARPVVERMLDDADFIAGLREVITANGGDWSSLKALIKAQVQDERDETGDGKRVRKILDKADYSAAYADMLGLAKVNEKNISAESGHDPETGEVLEESQAKADADAPADTTRTVAGEESVSRGAGARSSAETAEIYGRDGGERPTPSIAAMNAPEYRRTIVASAELPDIPACLDRRTKPPPQPGA